MFFKYAIFAALGFGVFIYSVFLAVASIEPMRNQAPVLQQSTRNHGPQPEAEKITYARLIEDLDRRIVSFEKLAQRDPNDWLMHDRLAGLMLEKAGLTGQSSDYVRIRRVLDKAFKNAPRGSGPLLTAAKFHYSIHELNRAEEYLTLLGKQRLLTGDKRTAGAILRANIAFQRGDYQFAKKVYAECEAAVPGLCRKDLALYEAHSGKFDVAGKLMMQSLAETDAKDARTKAWLLLQLGIQAMEQGRYDAALTRLNEADLALPGWWLVREHIAEVLTLKGDFATALEIYIQVVQETDLPQYMDALADCYAELGNQENARTMREKAAAKWESELKLLPDSASGHAMEHFLNNADSARLVQMAAHSFSLRPGGKDRSMLAEAYLMVGDVVRAKTELEAVLETPYVSADLYDLARRIYAAAGESDKAEQYKQLCLRLNPMYSFL